MRLYKILPASLWEARDRTLPLSELDRQDGFVHLSASEQVHETAALHFGGQTDLVLLEIDAAQLADESLRWESSRNGQRFPHVYADIPLSAVVGCYPLVGGEAGVFSFPAHLRG